MNRARARRVLCPVPLMRASASFFEFHSLIIWNTLFVLDTRDREVVRQRVAGSLHGSYTPLPFWQSSPMQWRVQGWSTIILPAVMAISGAARYLHKVLSLFPLRFLGVLKCGSLCSHTGIEVLTNVYSVLKNCSAKSAFILLKEKNRVSYEKKLQKKAHCAIFAQWAGAFYTKRRKKYGFR